MTRPSSPSAAHALSDTIESPHIPLPYRYRPAQPTETRRPLLLLLHGVGGDESSLAPLIERLPADIHVVLPRGPLAGPNGGHAWYSMQVTEAGVRAHPLESEAARVQVLHFIDALRQAHSFDPRQVYVAGFSQGGVISASVGLTRPDKVAAIGLLCGRILSQVKWQLAPDEQLSRLQAFLGHGGADGVIPSDYAVDAMHTMAEHRVQLLYRDYPGGHEISTQMADDFAQWVAQRAVLAYAHH